MKRGKSPACKLAGLALVAWLLLASWPQTAQAGWLITEGQGESQALTYIQGNRLRYEDADQITIFDLNKGTMTVLHPGSKRYWTGSPEDFNRQMKAAVDAKMETELKALSPQDRELFKEEEHAAGAGESGQTAKPQVKVERAAKTDKVAGRVARKHSIYVDGALQEEVWIAEDIDISKDLDADKFSKLMLDTRGDDMSDWEYDPQVRQLRARGLELKSVRHAATGPEESATVQKVEQKELPASTFQVPAGYEKATMDQFLE